MKFKKLFITMMALLLVVTLSSCAKKEVSIIIPVGTPTYASIFLDDTYQIDTVLGADPLVAAFGAKTYDVIVAPTNLGAKFYETSDTYQCLATISWGNLFLVSQNEMTLAELDGKDITAFGQNQTPDIIMSYVLSENDLTTNITYLASATEIASSFVLNPEGIYLVAEPQLSVLESSHTLHAIDLQQAYEALTGSYSYPQASVFVHKDLNASTIAKIEKDLKESIDQLYNEDNLSEVATYMNLSEAVASNVIDRCHIEYVRASEVQSDIEAYLQMMMSYNANLLSEIPGESFYR